jgi:PKD repeat protein
VVQSYPIDLSFTTAQALGSGGTPVPYQVAVSASADDSNNGGTVTQLSWDFGDGVTVTGDPQSESSPNHLYAHSGSYDIKLKATDNRGVQTTTDNQVNVGPQPAFSFTADNGDDPIKPQDQVDFSDSSGTDSWGTTLTTWSWDFGDGVTTTGTDAAHENPTHAYLAPGTYHVVLTVTDSLGQVATIQHDVTVVS